MGKKVIRVLAGTAVVAAVVGAAIVIYNHFKLDEDFDFDDLDDEDYDDFDEDDDIYADDDDDPEED